MIANQTPLKQNIQQRIVDRTDRLHLFPDTGVGVLSKKFYRYGIGSTNSESHNFFEALQDAFYSAFKSLFSVDGLKDDDIYLDVTVRTPNGNKLIPNLRLNFNAFEDKNSQILARLKKNESLYVKITYDGGRVTECMAINWMFENPGASKIAAETTVANAAGSVGTTLTTASTMYAPAASSPPYIAPNSIFNSAIQGFINQAAHNFGVDPNLIAAIITCESSGDPQATSATGAQGLMQIEPSTFSGLYAQVSAEFPGLPNSAYDPQTNIFCGAKYLHSLLMQFNSNIDSAIAAYNEGPGNVQIGISQGLAFRQFSETVNYVKKVKEVYAANCQRSTRLGLTKLEQRPEISQTEQTNATANSGQVSVAGGVG